MKQMRITIRNSGNRIPGLSEFGFGTEYFPDYVSQDKIHHSLDLTLLSLIIRGKCRHLIGNRCFNEQGPAAGITLAGGTHCLITGSEPIDVMNLYLDLERMQLPLLPFPYHAILSRLLPPSILFRNRVNQVSRLDLTHSSRMIPLLFFLHEELHAQRAGFEMAVMDYFRLFLLELCRCAEISGIQPLDLQASDVPPWGNQICAWPDTHYQEPVTLEMLTSQAGCSTSFLCRSFKKITGKTVFTYLMERRISAAMMRLRCGNEKIIGIAYDCGFQELGYFNRTFKRFTGQTPSDYRRSNQKKPE